MRYGNLGQLAIGMALVCVGIGIGSLLSPPQAAWGEVRGSAPPVPAFKSGDQISVPILRDIAATLHQIDGRVARLESLFDELSKPRPGSARTN